VEPIKPIVYYLDPATPEKLQIYQNGNRRMAKAFEGAGFKKCDYQRCTNLKKKTLILVQKTFGYSLRR
jgi:hypothetical protein